MSVRERVELLIALCEIVQYAHQRGIIHRDLKPSNILVEAVLEGKPRIKVIDFGIAKIIDNSDEAAASLTVAGERFGTPAYMSPEQAENCFNVDTRSDIYSLGVVLFEVLTGQTPFAIARSRIEKGWSPLAASDAIPKPSEWLRSNSHSKLPQQNINRMEWSRVRGDLDSIVLKALAGDRARRYQNVRELQRDLECFLEGKPVEARRPTMLYRMRKHIQRHRLTSVGILCFLGTVIGSSIVSTTSAIRARNAELLLRQKLEEGPRTAASSQTRTR